MAKVCIICKKEENTAAIADALTKEGYKIDIGIVYEDYPNEDSIIQYEIMFDNGIKDS